VPSRVSVSRKDGWSHLTQPQRSWEKGDTLSLDWSISDVRDWESLKPTNREDDTIPTEAHQEGLKTEALLWLTMGVGIREITEENLDEFFSRVDMWEGVHGSYLKLGGESYRLTYEDVARRVGLSTNASSMTKSAFHKSLIERLRTHARYRVPRKGKV